MKYIVALVFLLSVSSIAYGFVILEEQTSIGHKFIGFGTAGIFLVTIPLFLIVFSRGKKIKDYMLTDEKILKMKGKDLGDTDNQ